MKIMFPSAWANQQNHEQNFIESVYDKPKFAPSGKLAEVKNGAPLRFKEMMPGCVGFYAMSSEAVLYGEHWRELRKLGRV